MREQHSHSVLIPNTGNKTGAVTGTATDTAIFDGEQANQQRKAVSRLPSGIRARLFGLITLALLPILLLLCWIYLQRYETRRTQAMRTEMEVARGIATTFSTFVAGVHQQNFSLGQAILAYEQFDQHQLNQLLANVADQSPAIRNISWIDPKGIVLASSFPPLIGKDLSVRGYYNEVIAGAPWAIGNLTADGIVTTGPTLAIATAAKDEGSVLRGMVVTGLEPTRLNEVALIQERPAGGTYAIFDRNGVIVFTNDPNQPNWEARNRWKETDPVLQRALDTGKEQSGAIHVGAEGTEWFAARVPIARIGFMAGARRPEAVAMAPVRRSLYQSAMIAALVWLLAFLLALLVSQTIANPLHRLEQDARRMGTGKIEPHHDPQAPTEVRQLRRTVESMATTLIHQAEELRDSEARFRVMFHNQHTPMMVIDPDIQQIVDANPAASTFYGWPQETLRTMKITEINQLSPEQVQRIMKQAKESGSSILYYLRHRLASGETRDVEVSTGPIQVKEKQFLFAIVRDITERKRAEEELRQTTALLRALSETTPDPLFAKDTHGRILWANPATLHAIGRPAEQVFGHIDAEWLEDPQQAAVISANDRRVMETGQTEVVEETIDTPLGQRTFLITKSPMRGADGQVIGLVGVGQDVTERLQAEQELRERSEGLWVLAEAAQQLLSGSEPVAMLDHIYPRLAALLGLDAFLHYRFVKDGASLQLAGSTGVPESFFPRLEQFEIGQAICGRAALERRPEILHDVQHSTGADTSLIRSLGFTAYVCQPLIVQDQLVGTLSFGSRTRTAFDLQSVNLMRTTAALIAAAIYRRDAESTLQVYATRLEESNQDLQQFAFIASHDLQEPLRKVETFGKLLVQNSANLDEAQRDYLERMQQAASRMRRMVFDLLDLSRINTQGQPFVQVDLTKFAQEVVSDLEIQVHRTQGTVELEPLPGVQADPTQMRQLLQNLIGNGLKYHRAGVPPVVKVTGKVISPTKVEIRVEDNGIGFDPSQADRIFQPFQRLVGKSQYEGSGMGLAICRKIVERHHGKIEASSVPGQGSTFVITLPLSQGN